MTQQADEQRIKSAEDQNKQAQEAARKAIEEENEKRLQAQRDAVGQTETSTKGMTFKEAAEATEKLNQPPNFSSERERESVSGTPPPLTETTYPASTQPVQPPTNPDTGTTTTSSSTSTTNPNP